MPGPSTPVTAHTPGGCPSISAATRYLGQPVPALVGPGYFSHPACRFAFGTSTATPCVAAKRGILRRLGYVNGDRGLHGRPLVLWASLIYREAA